MIILHLLQETRKKLGTSQNRRIFTRHSAPFVDGYVIFFLFFFYDGKKIESGQNDAVSFRAKKKKRNRGVHNA